MHNHHQDDFYKDALAPKFRVRNVPHLITSDRSIIRPLIEQDATLVVAAISECIDHMRTWMPWDDKLPELHDVMDIVNIMYEETKQGTACHLMIYNNEDFMGMASLYNEANVPHCMKLGYWFRKFESATLTHCFIEALSAVSTFAFSNWKIKKLYIPCLAGNFYSEHAAKVLNFTLQEVRASGKTYIKIYELDEESFTHKCKIQVATAPK